MQSNRPSEAGRARYNRPPVHVNKSGVHSVNPADILRSSVGQSEIRKAADAARSGAVPSKSASK